MSADIMNTENNIIIVLKCQGQHVGMIFSQRNTSTSGRLAGTTLARNIGQY